MSVVSVHEIWKGRDADGSPEELRYSRVFRVWTDSGSDEGNVVGSSLETSHGIVYGAPYPSDTRARCVGIRPNNDLGNRGWLVTVAYSTKQQIEEAPEDDPVRISWDEEDIEVPVVKDRNGKAVLNSAGDPPDPPLMASDSILIARIVANASVVPSYIRAFRKSINTASFTIDGLSVSAKHARVRRISLGEEKTRHTETYREVQVELAILDNDEDDWELRFLDAGFRKRVLISGSTYGMEKITNRDKTEPTMPVPLNGSGIPLDSPTPDNCVYRTVPYYRLRTFGGNLPGCS